MYPTEVCVPYHSGNGHTTVLAEAVAAGARDAGAGAHLLPVAGLTGAAWDHLDRCDAMVFGSPTYMGNVSAAFQAFAESTSRRWHSRAWQDKVAAGFTTSGCKSGDKLHVLTSFVILAAQHGMHWVNLGVPPGWSTSTGSMDDLNRLGFALGAGAQVEGDRGPEATYPSDVETCRLLGARVARTAHLLRAGREALLDRLGAA